MSFLWTQNHFSLTILVNIKKKYIPLFEVITMHHLHRKIITFKF